MAPRVVRVCCANRIRVTVLRAENGAVPTSYLRKVGWASAESGMRALGQRFPTDRRGLRRKRAELNGHDTSTLGEALPAPLLYKGIATLQVLYDKHFMTLSLEK
jgi:hypothetical protein